MRNWSLLAGRVLLGIGLLTFLGGLTAVLVLLFGKYEGGNAWPDYTLTSRGKKSVADSYNVRMTMKKYRGSLVHLVTFRFKDETGNYRTATCTTNDYALVYRMGSGAKLPVIYDPKVFRRARVEGTWLYAKTPLVLPTALTAAAGLLLAIVGAIVAWRAKPRPAKAAEGGGAGAMPSPG
ncbi:MAG: hypothetical protein JNK60_04840 [Acidobacteria bacterium]|nr:hypothetical protein [Acidobacteriota bacterium]